MLNVKEEVATGINFALNEDQKMLQQLARDFAAKEIMPKAEEYDRSGEFPMDIMHKAREVGLVNLNIPEEYGGLGASVLEECIVGEEFAYACSGIQTGMMINQLAVLPILIAGNEEQKQRYFPLLTEDERTAAIELSIEAGARYLKNASSGQIEVANPTRRTSSVYSGSPDATSASRRNAVLPMRWKRTAGETPGFSTTRVR